MIANPSLTQPINLKNQKSSTAQQLGEHEISQLVLTQGQIPQKTAKQISSSQPRGNFIKKQKLNQIGNGTLQLGGQRDSSLQQPTSLESIQQLSNLNNSVSVMLNTRL